jgi:hypothetical protein
MEPGTADWALKILLNEISEKKRSKTLETISFKAVFFLFIEGLSTCDTVIYCCRTSHPEI